MESARSECYAAVARKQGRAELCDKVVSVRTPTADGSDLDKKYCKENLKNNVAYSVDPKVLARILESMGYNESNYRTAFEEPFRGGFVAGYRWESVFYTALNNGKPTAELVKRLSELPSY